MTVSKLNDFVNSTSGGGPENIPSADVGKTTFLAGLPPIVFSPIFLHTSLHNRIHGVQLLKHILGKRNLTLSSSIDELVTPVTMPDKYLSRATSSSSPVPSPYHPDRLRQTTVNQ